MAVAQPIVGTNAVVELVLVVAGTPTGPVITLKNSDWEITPDPNVAEGPNTSDGMIRAPGLYDYKGKIKGSTDATSATTAADSQAKAGAIYNFKIYRSKALNLFYAGTLIMGPLTVGTGTGTMENWSFDFLKQSGFLTYPDGTQQ